MNQDHSSFWKWTAWRMTPKLAVTMNIMMEKYDMCFSWKWKYKPKFIRGFFIFEIDKTMMDLL